MRVALTLILAAWLCCLGAAGTADAAPAHPHASRQAARHTNKHASKPAAKPAPIPLESTPSTVDPDGEGFLKLFDDLCIKRIDKLDAFRRKLLRTRVPKLQPERARQYLAGVDGDAWPVPYKGKTGNFVLVLAEQNDQCMLTARRTDRVAVEQGFTGMVAKLPADARTIARTKGDTRTLSASWTPRGASHRMRIALTTMAAPDAKLRAFGSVQLDPRLDPQRDPPADPVPAHAHRHAHAKAKPHPARKRHP